MYYVQWVYEGLKCQMREKEVFRPGEEFVSYYVSIIKLLIRFLGL